MQAKSKLKAVLASVPIAALFPARQGNLLAAPAGGKVAKRGRGRPKGARNRSSIVAESIVADFGAAIIQEKARLALMSPVEIAREWVADLDDAELDELRRIMGLTAKKARNAVDLLALAIRVKEAAGTDVLPFLKAKKIKLEGEGGLMQLNINLGGGAAPAGTARSTLGGLAALFPQSEGNQKVIEAQPAPSDAAVTDAAPKAEPDQ